MIRKGLLACAIAGAIAASASVQADDRGRHDDDDGYRSDDRGRHDDDDHRYGSDDRGNHRGDRDHHNRGGSNTGPFGFEPIAGSAAGDGTDFDQAAPWIIPEGFEQQIVLGGDEGTYGRGGRNIYFDPTVGNGNSNDWHDMNTVNESGRMAGRYLYRTHEVRGNAERGGTVSVIDLWTGNSRIVAEDPTFDALDGIEWTPWGTILFAEEVTNGRLFEIVLDHRDPMKAREVIDRPAVGRVAHEGVQVGPDGAV
jgi:hypothetical protein